MTEKLLVRRAAVLGAGVMGAQIAAHLVNAGVDTVLFDLPAKEGDPNGVVRKAIANLGKLSPAPLADKALLMSIYITLGIAAFLPLWVVIAVVSRDVMILGAVVVSWLVGKPLDIHPLIISKLNTLAQILLATLVSVLQSWLDGPARSESIGTVTSSSFVLRAVEIVSAAVCPGWGTFRSDVRGRG